MITAKVELTQPFGQRRQFAAQSGKQVSYPIARRCCWRHRPQTDRTGGRRAGGLYRVRRHHHPSAEAPPESHGIRSAGRGRSGRASAASIHYGTNSPCGHRFRNRCGRSGTGDPPFRREVLLGRRHRAEDSEFTPPTKLWKKKNRLDEAGSRGGGAELRGLAILAWSVWLLLPLTMTSAQAPPSALTLQQAVQIALEKNPQRKAAIADTKVAGAVFRGARSLLLPHLSFSETANRGNDPVFVFGSKLQQQRFTSADFALNQRTRLYPWGTSRPVLEEAGTCFEFLRQLARSDPGKADE